MEENQQQAQVTLRGIETKLNNMSSTGLTQPVDSVKHKADVATARAQATADRVMDLQQAMETDMKPKVENLKALTVEGIRRTNAQGENLGGGYTHVMCGL